MASRAAQSRLSSGPPSSPSFAASTRATAAKSRANASTPRRVVTNPSPRPPSSLQNRDDASSSAADSDDAALAHITETTKPSKKVETLYSHPNVKIITFSATARTAPRNPASPHSPKEVLTWSSHLERTIAMGEFSVPVFSVCLDFVSLFCRCLLNVRLPADHQSLRSLFRPLQDLQSAWISRFSQLRLGSAAHPV